MSLPRPVVVMLRPLAAFTLLFALVVACEAAGDEEVPATNERVHPPVVSPTIVPPLLTPVAEPPGDECVLGDGGTPVAVVDFDYEPQRIEISPGDTVSWTNTGQSAHTVTFADDGPECGRLAPAETVSLQFDSDGTFFYQCTIHPSMRGTVAVLE